MPFDYTFFDESLSTVRRLRSLVAQYGIFDGAAAIGMPEQLAHGPKVIWEAGGDSEEVVFDTTSYARVPGTNLEKLSEFMENKLPQDFLDFYQRYAEALVVTRSHPIHLWSEDRILEEATESTAMWNRKKPIRFFRFGEYYDYDAQMFGLWQEKPGSDVWKVVVTDHYTNDDEFDVDNVEPILIRGESFYEWLKRLVEKEGLPDPFFDVGVEGGYLDPV
ncbi:MAG: hypothetical protein RL693_2224 [Verrucomicrobiota bacterium]|jgi:hypothetical protein